MRVPPFFLPPVALTFEGNRSFDSEEVITYEVGYRTTFIPDVSIDFTAFYNDYKNLRSVELARPVFNGRFINQAYFLSNNHKAKTYGFEIATVWQMLDW